MANYKIANEKTVFDKCGGTDNKLTTPSTQNQKRMCNYDRLVNTYGHPEVEGIVTLQLVRENILKILATAVSISKSTTEFRKSEGDSLSVTSTSPSTYTGGVVWSSSDTSVATVSQDGVITALKAGTVTITATPVYRNSKNPISASCVCTINPDVIADAEAQVDSVIFTYSGSSQGPSIITKKNCSLNAGSSTTSAVNVNTYYLVFDADTNHSFNGNSQKTISWVIEKDVNTLNDFVPDSGSSAAAITFSTSAQNKSFSTTTAKYDKDNNTYTSLTDGFVIKDNKQIVIPANTNAGELKITIQVVSASSDNYDSDTKTAVMTFNVNKASGSCDISISGWNYNSAPNTPTYNSSTNNDQTPTITYYKSDGTKIETPTSTTPVGSYYVKVEYPENTNYTYCYDTASFTIASEGQATPPTITVVSSDLKYTGSAQTIATIDSDAINGTAEFNLTTTNRPPAAADTGWTTYANITKTISKTDVGTYYIWYRVTADSNHTDIDTTLGGSKQISKGDGQCYITIDDWGYGNTPSSPNFGTTTNTGATPTVAYYTTGGTDVTDSLNSLDAGDYYVRVSYAATSNYESCEAVAYFTVNPVPGSGTISMSSWTYSSTEITVPDPQVTSNPNNTTVTYTWYDSSKGKLSKKPAYNSTPGTYYVTGTFAKTNNFNEYTTDYVEFKIYSAADATVTFTYGTNGSTPWTYDKTSHSIVVTTKNCTKTSGTTTAIYAGQWAATYTADDGHTFGDNQTTKTITWEIKKATGSGSVTINGWTYGSTPNEPSPSSTTNGVTNVQYSWYKKIGTSSYTGIGTSKTASSMFNGIDSQDAGIYAVEAIFGETTNYEAYTTDKVEFTISKASLPNFDKDLYLTIGDDFEYDGVEHDGIIVNDSYAPGVIYVGESNNSTSAPTSWSVNDIKALAVGSHFYWYKVVPTDTTNYNSIAATYFGNVLVTAADVADYLDINLSQTLEYNGSDQVLGTISITNEDAQGVCRMGLGSSSTSVPTSWSEGSVSASEVGTYHVWYKFDSEYPEFSDVSATYKGDVTISKSSKGTATVNITGWKYGDTPILSDKMSIISSTNDTDVSNATLVRWYEVTNATGNQIKQQMTGVPSSTTTPGFYYAVVRVGATDNYTAITVSSNVWFISNGSLGTCTISANGWEYADEFPNPVVDITSNPQSANCTFYYFEDDKTTSVTTPTTSISLDVGDYAVKAVFTKTNYTSVTVWDTFTVEKGGANCSVSMTAWTYGDTPTDPVPVSSTNGTSNVTYSYQYYSSGTWVNLDAKPTSTSNTGTYKVNATFAASGNYNIGYASAVFTINKATNNVVFNGEAESDTVFYSTSDQYVYMSTADADFGEIYYVCNTNGFSLAGIENNKVKIKIPGGTSSGTYSISVTAKVDNTSNYYGDNDTIIYALTIKEGIHLSPSEYNLAPASTIRVSVLGDENGTVYNSGNYTWSSSDIHYINFSYKTAENGYTVVDVMVPEGCTYRGKVGYGVTSKTDSTIVAEGYITIVDPTNDAQVNFDSSIFTYNGRAQGPTATTINCSFSEGTVSETNAGEYEATYEAATGHTFSDGTDTEEKSWSIEKDTNTITWNTTGNSCCSSWQGNSYGFAGGYAANNTSGADPTCKRVIRYDRPATSKYGTIIGYYVSSGFDEGVSSDEEYSETTTAGWNFVPQPYGFYTGHLPGNVTEPSFEYGFEIYVSYYGAYTGNLVAVSSYDDNYISASEETNFLIYQSNNPYHKSTSSSTSVVTPTYYYLVCEEGGYTSSYSHKNNTSHSVDIFVANPDACANVGIQIATLAAGKTITISRVDKEHYYTMYVWASTADFDDYTTEAGFVPSSSNESNIKNMFTWSITG